MKPSTVDDVFDLLDGVFTSAALGAAMECRKRMKETVC